MTAPVSSWDKTLLVQRIMAAMAMLHTAAGQVTTAQPGLRAHADEAVSEIGRFGYATVRDQLSEATHREIAPVGTAMSGLWKILGEIRSDWLRDCMVRDGFSYRWEEKTSGDALRRATEHYRALDEAAPSVADVVSAFNRDQRNPALTLVA